MAMALAIDFLETGHGFQNDRKFNHLFRLQLGGGKHCAKRYWGSHPVRVLRSVPEWPVVGNVPAPPCSKANAHFAPRPRLPVAGASAEHWRANEGSHAETGPLFLRDDIEMYHQLAIVVIDLPAVCVLHTERLNGRYDDDRPLLSVEGWIVSAAVPSSTCTLPSSSLSNSHSGCRAVAHDGQRLRPDLLARHQPKHQRPIRFEQFIPHDLYRTGTDHRFPAPVGTRRQKNGISVAFPAVGEL